MKPNNLIRAIEIKLTPAEFFEIAKDFIREHPDAVDILVRTRGGTKVG